jgi:zinc protease
LICKKRMRQIVTISLIGLIAFFTPLTPLHHSESAQRKVEPITDTQKESAVEKEYHVKKETDDNGYEYEIVTHDPFGLRVYTLDNGLKVYLRKHTDRPRIQTYIAVKAGSVYDPPDSIGLAHLLEHMMFKGTSKVGTLDWEREKVLIQEISHLYEQYRNEDDPVKRKEIYSRIDEVSNDAAKYAIANEYDKLCDCIGAEGTNAYTSYEETVYEDNIPSNELKRWLKLERERFGELVLRFFHTEMDAIYEEFNMSEDEDWNKVDEALMAGLFKKHPYGTQTILGNAEHIKNPSMVDINNYRKSYYVPNNMAICMSGDLDFDKTIQMIDKYWGDLKEAEVPQFTTPKEEPITEPVIKEVYGPEAEYMSMAFRFDGYKSGDIRYVLLIDNLLNNYQAGLIDLNLVLEQKVNDAGSYSYFMKDYGAHEFYGYPRKGQKLEEVKDLILGELEKIKKGKFEDWLFEAVLKNFRLSRISSQEGNGIANTFVTCFIYDVEWVEYVKFLDDLEKITKEEIVEFADEHYKDNYVVVYKRTGEDPDVIKIDKHTITPVPVNRDVKSDFFQEFEKEEVDPIRPVFVDYEKEIHTSRLKSGIEFNYIQNKTNELFTLSYIIDMGKNHIKKLPLAVNYLTYLGTDKYSPAEIQQEFYKLGLSFDVFSGEDRCYVYISGLEESAEKGIELLEHILAHVKPNRAAYREYIDGILKDREDSKLDKYLILWNALYNYGMYGKNSSFTNIYSDKELRKIKPKELTDLIKEIYSYQHKIFYYGQYSAEKAKALIDKYHEVPAKLKPYPDEITYPELPTDENKVYFVDYDMTQVNVVMFSKDVIFNKDLIPSIRLFNEYYGGSMASIVFQEIRESKGLAYSAYAGFDIPYKADDSHYVFAFVGTQPDKLENAMETMLDLLNNMPRSRVQFDLSCNSVFRQIETERIIKADIFWTYQSLLRKNIDYDYRMDVYDAVKTIDMADLSKFYDEHVKDKKYTFLVIGDKEEVDMDVLQELGTVEKLTLEEIFSY